MHIMNDQDLLYTVEEAAQQLRVSPDTIRRLLRDQKMKGVRVGGQWRVPAQAVRTVYLPIGWFLNEQVETLKDHRVGGVPIPAGTVGYVIRHSTGAGGHYLNTITVCPTPIRPYGQDEIPAAFDLNVAEENVTWKFVSSDGSSPSITVPRALLQQIKDMLNEAYAANSDELMFAIMKQLYSLLTIVLGKDDGSDNDAIAKSIRADMEPPPVTSDPLYTG